MYTADRKITQFLSVCGFKSENEHMQLPPLSGRGADCNTAALDARDALTAAVKYLDILLHGHHDPSTTQPREGGTVADVGKFVDGAAAFCV